MPIINKGIFSTDTVFIRQTGNDWPTAQVTTTSDVIETSGNLYFTNARVYAAISNGLTGNLTVTGSIFANTFVGNNLIVNGVSIFSGEQGANLTVTKITANIWNGLYTANVIESPNNLYFSNARANAAIWPSLTAANIANFSSTVNTTIRPMLTTANVIETSANLYFTNARVSAALSGSNISVYQLTANIAVFGEGSGGAVTGANLISAIYLQANSWLGLYTANVVESPTNLFYTNSRVISAVNPLFTTANVTELTNQYFTNVRVLQVVNPLLTTANVTELTNLYFTNARARTAITGGTGVTVNWSTGAISIGQDVSTTANVTFYNVSVTNNLTVYGGVETFLANNLVVSDNMIYLNNGSLNSNPDIGFAANYNDGIYHHTGFFRDASDGVWKVFENYSPEPDANIFIDTSHASFRIANIQATTLIGNITGTAGTLDNFTTTDLKEGSNLYYTNARARTAFTGGTGILVDWSTGIITANAAGIATGLTTADVREASSNLYFTNTRVIAGLVNSNIQVQNLYANNAIYANVIYLNNIAISGNNQSSATFSANVVADSITSNIWVGLYTANVIETSGNLYFTNARVIAGLVNSTIQVQNLYANDAIYANAIYLNNIAISGNNQSSSTFSANIVADSVTSNIWNRLYTANVIETPGNLYFTYARANATVWPSLTAANIANFNSTVNTIIYPSLTTANVIETSSNLYYTNARARTAFIAGSGIIIDWAAGTISSNAAGIVSGVTTADVREVSSNLYFTNTRVLSALSNANIEGNLRVSRSIYANSVIINGQEVFSSEQGSNLFVTQITANIWVGLYTANVIETSGNLYFTNARVISGLVNSNIQVQNLYANNAIYANAIYLNNIAISGNSQSVASFSNTIVADSVTSNIWNGLYTANVIETSGNLYFTNARARAVYTAGNGVTIDSANGIISANTLNAINILNSTQRIQSTGTNTYTLNAPISTPESILVVVEGLVQIPSLDYTVSGTTLTFADYPTVNSNIEIRYYGTDAIFSSTSITTKVDSFIGTGANTYTLSINPPSKDSITVIVNGVYRQSDQYSITNKALTFNVAPAVGANVDVRTISGIAGTSFNTRSYTANGVSNTFVITDGFTQDTILVFENGITQVPGTDYTVVGNSVYFATAPATNVVIQIRELGVTGLAGGTTAGSIRGYDLTTGNLTPTTNSTKNLGSSTYSWNNSYVNQAYISNVIILGSTTISTTGSSITLVSGGTTTTISGPTQSSRAFGLALIFGG